MYPTETPSEEPPSSSNDAFPDDFDDDFDVDDDDDEDFESNTAMPDSPDMELKGMPMSESESYKSVGSQQQVEPTPEEYTEFNAHSGMFVNVFVGSARFLFKTFNSNR